MLILSGAGGGLINGMAYDELNGNDSLNLEEISYGISAAGVKYCLILIEESPLISYFSNSSILSFMPFLNLSG